MSDCLFSSGEHTIFMCQGEVFRHKTIRHLGYASDYVPRDNNKAEKLATPPDVVKVRQFGSLSYVITSNREAWIVFLEREEREPILVDTDVDDVINYMITIKESNDQGASTLRVFQYPKPNPALTGIVSSVFDWDQVQAIVKSRILYNDNITPSYAYDKTGYNIVDRVYSAEELKATGRTRFLQEHVGRIHKVSHLHGQPTYTVLLLQDGTVKTYAENASYDSGRINRPEDYLIEAYRVIPRLYNPFKFPKNDNRIVDMDDGGRHLVFLTAKGTVYTVGYDNSHGQLGRDVSIYNTMPYKLDLPPVVAISAGNVYTMVATTDGRLLRLGGIPEKITTAEIFICSGWCDARTRLAER